ncbi:MAG: hypothetical protein KF823_10400 [Xanthomonadales bacterium]|nr:hypothetical protein [Xanthomonadales bacterium]
MKRVLFASIALAFGANAMANTCAAPLPIAGGTINGDTCTAPNSLPSYGGTVSPQREVVYSFVAQDANGSVAISGPIPDGAVFLMPSPCSSSTDPIAFGFAGTPMAVTGLTNGQTYYVIVTTDPGGPNDACGAYTLNVTPQLPVELQSFTID